MKSTLAFDPFAASLGISFVPVSRKTKKPYHDGWTSRDAFSPEDFDVNDNQGGRWGERSDGIVDIDCDIPQAARIARLRVTKGPIWGRRSNPSSHYLVRCPGAKTRQFLNPLVEKDKMIVEIRSTGSQSVLPPSIHTSGEVYAWERQEAPGDTDPQRLNYIVSEIASAALIATVWGEGNRHAFALALAGFLVKQGVPKERAEYLMEMVAVGAEDRELPDRLRAVSDTYQAYSDGQDIEAHFYNILGKEKGQLLAKTLGQWLGLERNRFRIYNEQDLTSRPEAPYIVKGAVVKGSLIAVIAPPDIGKTFLSLDLALHLAAGQPHWLGKKILTAGPVFYVVAEGAGRFKLRYLAWKQVHRVTRPLPFYWVDQPVPLLDGKAAHAFIRQVAPIKPTLIKFDTLSRCLAGADENSAKDMGKAVEVLDELRSRTGACVSVLHHTKKDGTVERGSSVLRGAVDTILTLHEDKDDPNVLTLKCERQKDAEPFEPIALFRKSVQLDGIYDEEGNPETSCVIEMPSVEEVVFRESGEEKKRRAIVECVQGQKGGCSKSAIHKAVGGNRGEVWKRLTDMINDRTLVVNDRGNLEVSSIGAQLSLNSL
jgi:hypothetical protein